MVRSLSPGEIGPVAYELELPQYLEDFILYSIPACYVPSGRLTWSTQDTESAVDELELEDDDKSYEVERAAAMAMERAQW